MTFKTHRLSNGFRVVTEHMPGFDSASLGIWVAAGARDETPEENGIAHFLEHMAFKGTKTRSALQIAEAIEDVGGYLNAYTSRETTAYYARVLNTDAALALELIADILVNPVVDPAELDIERGVILQEIGQSLDTPDDVIFDWLQEQAYPDQAMGRPILGPAELVNRFHRDDLMGFIERYYVPERMILAAAGGVDHEALCRQAETLFGHLKPREPQAMSKAVFHGGELSRTKELEQAHMALAFEGPSYRDAEIYAAQVYSVALGGGMSSRLFQNIREKRGLCYTIFAQAGAYADTGMLSIYAGTGGDQLSQLAQLTFDEMRRAAEDFTDAEIDRARAQMKAGMLMGLEGPSSRAERLARMLQIWGKIPQLAETVAQIDAVSRQNVLDFGQKLLEEAPAAMALYGPFETAPMLRELRERKAA